MKRKRLDNGNLSRSLQLQGQEQRKSSMPRQLKKKTMITQRSYLVNSSEQVLPLSEKTRLTKLRKELITSKVKKQQNDDSPKVRNNDRRVPNGTVTCSIGLRIEQETNQKLIDLCLREGISKSALIKRLIRQYIEQTADE